MFTCLLFAAVLLICLGPMMVLKDVHDKVDEIPAEYRPLYTEKAGKWELTGIQGVKTTADVTRVQTALDKERDEHKTTKASLTAWGDLKHDDVVAKLDRIGELEEAAKGKIDETKLEELAQKRAEAMVKSKLAPVERELKTTKRTLEELTTTNVALTTREHARAREDVIRPLLVELKITPEHHEDVLLYAERHLARADDGTWSVKEGVQVGGAALTTGSTPKDWLTELAAKRPGWMPGSQGGGARGSGPNFGGFGGGANPWSADGWNMTEQGQYVRTHGKDKAEAAAKAAGTKLGGPRPAAKK